MYVRSSGKKNVGTLDFGSTFDSVNEMLVQGSVDEGNKKSKQEQRMSFTRTHHVHK